MFSYSLNVRTTIQFVLGTKNKSEMHGNIVMFIISRMDEEICSLCQYLSVSTFQIDLEHKLFACNTDRPLNVARHFVSPMGIGH